MSATAVPDLRRDDADIEAAPPPKKLRIASYNLHKCVGSDGRFRPDRIVDVLAELNTDIVAVQEVDRRFGRRTGVLEPSVLLKEAGLTALTQSDLPDGLGWHGNALLVRGEPLSYRRRRLSLPGIEPRGAVIAELDFGGGAFRVVAAHLGLFGRCRARQAGTIMAELASLPPMPTVLLGDLNEWRGGGTSLAVLEPFFGRAPRCPSFPSRFPLLSLDRILGWPGGLVEGLEVHDTPLARSASDHLPIKGRLNLAAAMRRCSAHLSSVRPGSVHLGR